MTNEEKENLLDKLRKQADPLRSGETICPAV